MGKARASSLIGALIILAVVVALAATGCGTAANAARQGAAAPTTAEGILAQAVASSQKVTSGAGEFNLSLAIAGDASKMPAGSALLFGQPIAVSGTFAFNGEAKAADATISASIAGQNLTAEVKAADKKAWIQFMGQWYELPANMMQKAGVTSTPISTPDTAAIMQAIKAAGIDPATWLTGLKLVGDDTIDGTATYHLQGTLDFNKIMTDAMKLMQDKSFQSMIDSMSKGLMGSASTEATGGTSSSVTASAAQRLQTVGSQLATMFKNLTIDMWIAKDSYQMRQAQVDATIVPPAGQDAKGISSATLKLTVSMAPATTPLTVTAPVDAKPFSDLQTALKGLVSLLAPVLEGEAVRQP